MPCAKTFRRQVPACQPWKSLVGRQSYSFAQYPTSKRNGAHSESLEQFANWFSYSFRSFLPHAKAVRRSDSCTLVMEMVQSLFRSLWSIRAVHPQASLSGRAVRPIRKPESHTKSLVICADYVVRCGSVGSSDSSGRAKPILSGLLDHEFNDDRSFCHLVAGKAFALRRSLLRV